MRMSPDLDEPASPNARLMQARGLNLCILSVMGYKTTIDVKLYKKELEQTLLKHPRFTSLLIIKSKTRGHYSWKQTTIDLENHIFAPDLDPHMESPEEFLENYTSTLSKTPMDLSKPLWEIHILNVKTLNANSTAIFKIHHSIGDGVSLMSLLLACGKKISDPKSLPVVVSSKKKQNEGLMIKRVFLWFWMVFLVIFWTLMDGVAFLATALFLTDTRTLIKGGRRGEVGCKRFVHRIVKLEEVKLIKNAMNVSVNDVVLGVTEAGLSRYLNMRYEKEGENGEESNNKKKSSTNYLPRNIYLRSAVVFNLRKSPKIEDLALMMEGKKELKGMWGNLVGIVLLPITIDLQDDPLSYVRRAKATMDRKKLSFGHKWAFHVMNVMMYLFGTKTAAVMTKAIFRHTTLTFSNVMGPREEMILFGHPLGYIAPSVNGFPQSLIIHYQSYEDKLIISIGADENFIPNPHQLCDDLVKSLENIKEAVTKRGLVDAC